MTERSASMPEIKAVRVPRERYDVAILGGGLAGLSLANQLKLARPEYERARHRQARRAGP